ncbi:Extracellular sulfatase, C-terminal,Alkaline-phosphatase-like, core domain,Alkaline phosphatase-like [Cinara cedri]|uniref:Extracellular sulfatase, C-terminal,Alkaline-phosphatase-like, core domain,Alkaline phosphatase-like n=1 Tax=Cinara cedri TaxID=506608 RepID=A0A5E4M431_9HEMI|nr:Extracellular sulfatase, C-terminal,Alkaline-phosphatase-like, core domain,Alkaline phosphatase-like [Cinara cedri]
MDTASRSNGSGGRRGRLLCRYWWWLTVLSWCVTSSALDQDGFMVHRDNAVLPRRGRIHKFRKSQQRPEEAKNDEPQRRPNIVLMLTDDQDVELGSLNYMEKTKKLLRDEGAEFRHAYSTTPMCCPSRSSLLTGLYTHNHEVFTNNDNCSGPVWQNVHESRTFATYLTNDAGYHTGYFGKYLNKYNGSYIPPGWRQWGGLIMNSKYYNYSVNLNGKKIKHGDDYHKDYYPNLVTNDSINFLRYTKQHHPHRPFMLVMSFPSPHGPEDSAPEYSNMFFNVTSHHTPTYDFAPNPDKQWILQVTGHMLPIHREFTNLLMTKRLQTLQSVDDSVSRVYEELKQLGELENTYIIYTSDHGYHLGQFGLVKGKSFPFEFDVRVPMLVRGPGIEPGTKVNEIVLNIDLAPTFLDIAGVSPPPHMDGRSAFKLFHKHKKGNKKFVAHWPDTFLIESSGRREHNKNKKNSTSSLLSNNNDFSIEDDLEMVAGSKASKLFVLCQRPDYQTPCKPAQKWHCIHDGFRWRKHKCNLKKRNELLNGLNKCTCFTADGNLYTKLEIDKNKKHISKNSKMPHRNRFRREILTPLNNNMSSIINVLNKKIDVLQTSVNDSSLASCTVTPNGDVKCTNIVYNNPKVWKFSQSHIQKQILNLQVKLEKLKEIQKHLEKKRPNFEEKEDEDEHNEEDSAFNFSTDYSPAQWNPSMIPVHNYNMGPDSVLVDGVESHRLRHHHGNKQQSENVTETPTDSCYCVPFMFSDNDPALNKEVKKLLKVHRQKKKGRKFRKKNSKLNKECMLEKMNCFNHDNDHWRTAPFWTEGPFCFCMNANNNTYSCLRTINATHNFLYCEFVTGLVTFYNMKFDLFQQWNQVNTLEPKEREWLRSSLAEMIRCKGSAQCALSPVKRRKKLEGFNPLSAVDEAITSKKLLMDQPKDVDIVRYR